MIARRLRRLGRGPDDDEATDAWAEEAPVLAGLAAASVQGTVAWGPRRGARLSRLGAAAEPVETPDPGSCHARVNGCDLHAGLVVPAGQRERLGFSYDFAVVLAYEAAKRQVGKGSYWW